MKKQTNYQEMQQKMEATKKQVCKILGWTDMQYCENQYIKGIAYLHWCYPVDEEARLILESSRVYWNWWKLNWHSYDESWATYKIALHDEGADFRTRHYHQLHNPRLLVNEIQPNIYVINDLTKKRRYNNEPQPIAS